MRKLQENDSKVCESFNEYQSATSEALIRSLILINGGYGLFSKSNGELLSFAIINDHFAVSMLHTVEQARGRKYGEFIAKFVSLKIAEEFKVSPMCFIDPSNTPSINLFTKLGYKKVGDCNWIAVEIL